MGATVRVQIENCEMLRQPWHVRSPVPLQRQPTITGGLRGIAAIEEPMCRLFSGLRWGSLQPGRSHLLAVGLEILQRDVALPLSVDFSEVPRHPRHVRGLSLLQRQPPIVSGVRSIEAIEESVRLRSGCLRGVLLGWSRRNGLSSERWAGQTSGHQSGEQSRREAWHRLAPGNLQGC
ncbi:MAG TPA: hypothetical protein VGI78_28860 [Acetobacteraceae bacterium]|jgi:hypothetical protein